MTYSYSAAQWLLVFYLYCVLGWCFESTVVSVEQRRWVNRGFLRGPMLPIYGFGAVILLHVSLPLQGHPVWSYLACMTAATVFEYIVGVVMEKIFKVKYWDYSKQRFQFQGYICLRSSLCWGFLGLILTGVIHPPINALVVGLPFIGLIIIDVLFSAAFVSDVVVSVRSALDLAKVLVELDRLREQGAELRKQLSETALVELTNLSYKVEEAHGEFTERMDEAKAQLAERMDEAREKVDDAREQLAAAREMTAEERRAQAAEAREQLQAKLAELQRRFDERAAALGRTRKSLLRGNPTARSERYGEVLERLKKRIDTRTHR
ncbi:hypothetical protein [uncultured Agathobaculum sp.]|uniref:putative ABC transporter permease n=1 Tax=uncultured Agathobaculum sp. TaxID=2048140 RepID=UPI00296F448A